MGMVKNSEQELKGQEASNLLDCVYASSLLMFVESKEGRACKKENAKQFHNVKIPVIIIFIIFTVFTCFNNWFVYLCLIAFQI